MKRERSRSRERSWTPDREDERDTRLERGFRSDKLVRSKKDPSEREREKERDPRNERNWPSTNPSRLVQLQGAPGADLAVQKIVFGEEGRSLAVSCEFFLFTPATLGFFKTNCHSHSCVFYLPNLGADHTLRIWETKPQLAEVARLAHNAAIAAVCWMAQDAGVLTLGVDGIVNTWTREVVFVLHSFLIYGLTPNIQRDEQGKEWKYGTLLSLQNGPSSDVPVCMTYAKDRIAISTLAGVKVWLLISGMNSSYLFYCLIPDAIILMA